jgi:signal transduction histidine kinase
MALFDLRMVRLREIGGNQQRKYPVYLYSISIRTLAGIFFAYSSIKSWRPVRQLLFNRKNRWEETLIFPIPEKDKNSTVIGICTSDITRQIEAEEHRKQVLLELITAQEDERHRISRDLHDDVGQKMTELLFELRMIKESVEKKRVVSLEEINSVIQNMETTIKRVRQIFYQLYPPSLSKMPLPKVLSAFCSTFEVSNNLHVDFSCQEDFPELPDLINTAIYRFVQEGLTNVIKHARASSAWINLDYTDGDLNVSLEDNGRGFNPKSASEGIGLQSIRERFLMLDGSFEIESAPHMGTRLSGMVPFNAQND